MRAQQLASRSDALCPVSRPLQLTRTSDLPAGGQSLIDLKSTYCFCAHMHEIMKYFLLTENQQQFLNSEHVPDPANPAPICVILMRRRPTAHCCAAHRGQRSIFTLIANSEGYGTTMARIYAQFNSYDSVGYVLTLHDVSPPLYSAMCRI